MGSGKHQIGVALTFLLVALILTSGLSVKQEFTLNSSATKYAKIKTLAPRYWAYASVESSNGAISIIPSVLNLTATHVKQTFSFTVWVNDSTNIGGWQVYVDFDDTFINMTDWEEPVNDSQYIFAGKTTMAVGSPPGIIYVHEPPNTGHVQLGAFLYPVPPAQQPSSGTGKLCTLVFEILSLLQAGQRLTLPLHINTTSTFLIDPESGGSVEDVAIYDGVVQIESRALNIQLLTPENKTYATNSIIANFTIDGQTSWIGYSLDGQANVTIAGNTTLSDLSEGAHDVVIYANDTAGNVGASDKVWFTIQASPLSPFLILILGTIVIAASIVLSFLYYFIRRRKKAHTT